MSSPSGTRVSSERLKGEPITIKFLSKLAEERGVGRDAKQRVVVYTSVYPNLSSACIKQFVSSLKFGTKSVIKPITPLKIRERTLDYTYNLPVYSSQIPVKRPISVDDYIEGYLDLNTEFIKNPAFTFMIQVTDNSMEDIGIFSKDWLMVDRSLESIEDSIVVGVVNGEYIVKRLSRKQDRAQLHPTNLHYNSLDSTEDQDMVIWGVVTLVIHELIER